MTFYGINTFEVWISGQRRREFDWQEMTGEKKKKKNLTLIGLLLSSHGIFMLHYKTITNVSPGGNRDSVVLGCITKQPDGTTERRSKEQHTVHMVCLFTFDLLPSFLSEQQQRAWRSCVGSTDGERGGAGWSGVVPLMRVSDCRLIRRLSLSQGGITLKHDSSETRALSVSLSTDPRPQEKKKKKSQDAWRSFPSKQRHSGYFNQCCWSLKWLFGRDVLGNRPAQNSPPAEAKWQTSPLHSQLIIKSHPTPNYTVFHIWI